MLALYLNQTAKYCAGGAPDKYGDISTEATQFLSCRKEPCVKLIQTAQGELYQTTTRYFLGTEVKPLAWKDQLDDLIVAQVTGLIAFDGTSYGYEVLT